MRSILKLLFSRTLRLIESSIAGIVFAWLIVEPAVAATITAMVTDLRGRAVLSKTAGQPSLSILSELTTGAELVLDKDAAMHVIYIKSGEQFAISGPGRVMIAADSPKLSGAGTLARLPAPLIAQGAKLKVEHGRVIQAAIVMRDGKPRPPVQIGPSQKILDSNPQFRWIPVHSDALTTFELFDDEMGTTAVQAQVKGGTYQLPNHVSLRPGRTYYWSIHPSDAESSAPKRVTSFTLATEEERNRLLPLKPQDGASFSDRLVYAMLLNQEGFHNDAKAIWQQLSEERPHLGRLKEMAAQ